MIKFSNQNPVLRNFQNTTSLCLVASGGTACGILPNTKHPLNDPPCCCGANPEQQRACSLKVKEFETSWCLPTKPMLLFHATSWQLAHSSAGNVENHHNSWELGLLCKGFLGRGFSVVGASCGVAGETSRLIGSSWQLALSLAMGKAIAFCCTWCSDQSRSGSWEASGS